MQSVTELPYARPDPSPVRAASGAISLFAHALAATAVVAAFSGTQERPTPTPARTVSLALVPRAALVALATPEPSRRALSPNAVAPPQADAPDVNSTPWAPDPATREAPVAQAMVVGRFDAGTKLRVTSAQVAGDVILGGFGHGGDTSDGTSRSATGGDAPLQVLSEPVPHYPEEAQRLGITGEVLLLVRFAASGELRVVRTIRGLGRGLDEAAIVAAQQVRFLPAIERGQPVDVVMQIKVVFKL